MHTFSQEGRHVQVYDQWLMAHIISTNSSLLFQNDNDQEDEFYKDSSTFLKVCIKKKKKKSQQQDMTYDNVLLITCTVALV